MAAFLVPERPWIPMKPKEPDQLNVGAPFTQRMCSTILLRLFRTSRGRFLLLQPLRIFLILLRLL